MRRASCLVPLALPLLYAAYPVLAMLAHNIEEASEAEAGRALAWSILGSVALLLVLRMVIRDWGKASLICAVLLLVFFSYGHVYAIARTWSLGGFLIGRHRYLLPLGLSVTGAWTWFVLRRLKKTDTVLAFFALVGLASLFIPTYTIVAYQLANSPAAPPTQATAPATREASTKAQPDVYYIVLDGYARDDVLRDLYRFDNSEFLTFLEDRGFYVAREARSNYMVTWLSLGSSLNMRYLDDVVASIGETSTDLRPVREMLHHSLVRHELSGQGYRMVAFRSGYNPSTIPDADVYLGAVESARPNLLFSPVNEFDGLLLESTMARAIFDARSLLNLSCVDSPIEVPYLQHRKRVLYTLDALQEIPEWEGSYFVLAHIVSPHPPFVFGQDGEMSCHEAAYSLADGTDFAGPVNNYIASYRDQLTYLNGLLARTLDRILRKSDPAPIIILQADHGPGAYLDWGSVEQSNVRERLGILNAYYLPGHDADRLYESISPVNSFRVVFNLYFGGQYDLLGDESYFSVWGHPYDFVRVTERVDSD